MDEPLILKNPIDQVLVSLSLLEKFQQDVPPYELRPEVQLLVLQLQSVLTGDQESIDYLEGIRHN